MTNTTSTKGHQTQAIGSDPQYRLDLAPNFMPDIDLVIAEGVAAFGVKGSGKSNACARLGEQLSRFPIPYFIPCTKGEYISLKDIKHATRFVIATANACPSGQQILTERLQVVMDLRSWESDEGAALAMAQILNEMFAYASSQDQERCIPCPCILDEAQYWLPQNSVSYLAKDVAQELRDAWHVLATRARSLGLVPSYFTQNISELHKSVMRQCGMYFLMRQTLDNDLDRYCEFIHHTSPAQLKASIRAFPAGKAIVLLPNGERIKTTFNQRESKHTSNTPTVRALMASLAQQPIVLPQEPIEDERTHEAPEAAPVAFCESCGKAIEEIAPTGRPRKYCNDICKGANHRKRHKGDKEQALRTLLAENPGYTVSQMQILTGYSLRDVERIVTRIQDTKVKQAPSVETNPNAVQQIRDALEHDSDLSPMELAQRFQCDLELAKQTRTAFFYGNIASQSV